MKIEKVGRDLFAGILIQCDVPNDKNIIYPKHIIQRECARYNEEKIKNNTAIGEMGFQNSHCINLSRVTHTIISLEESGNDFIAIIKILDTPDGKIVKELIEYNVDFELSMRGMGITNLNNNGNYIIDDDYKLITIDIIMGR